MSRKNVAHTLDAIILSWDLRQLDKCHNDMPLYRVCELCVGVSDAREHFSEEIALCFICYSDRLCVVVDVRGWQMCANTSAKKSRSSSSGLDTCVQCSGSLQGLACSCSRCK